MGEEENNKGVREQRTLPFPFENTSTSSVTTPTPPKTWGFPTKRCLLASITLHGKTFSLYSMPKAVVLQRFLYRTFAV
jgi:hypothetical protein